MSWMDRYPAPLTVGELRRILDGFPDDAVFSHNRYAGDFDMNQATTVEHLVEVTPAGNLRFGSNADYWIDDDYGNREPPNLDADDALDLTGADGSWNDLLPEWWFENDEYEDEDEVVEEFTVEPHPAPGELREWEKELLGITEDE